MDVEAFLGDIIDTVADPIFVKDEQHRWILINEAMCEFLGYPREELLGKSDFDFFPAEEAKVFWEKDNEVFRSGKQVENEERITGADGTTSIISTKKSIFINEQGEKILVGVIRDLTTLKATEQELRIAWDEARRANEAKTQFLANASHELRTPLNGIVGIVELLKDRPWEGELKELVEVLKDSADNLLNLVNDLLDVSAIDSGSVKVQKRAFSPGLLLSSIESLFEGQVDKSKLNLRFHIDDDVPQFVVGDGNRIRQILVNLISNSTKFTPENGTVDIALNLTSRGEMRFEVIDDGVGVPPEQLNEVFVPFAKARPGDQGTGLGLAISRQLAELMGGKLWLEAPGRGCRAVLELPFDTAIPRKGAEAADPATPTFPGLQVLVVEDDPVSQKVAILTLKRLGCEVTHAGDGLEALEILETESFDLILMDCRMPNLNGYSTAERIRKKEKSTGSRVPIFALTAHAFEEDREKCLSAGMDRWLTKPLQRRALVESISEFFPPVY